MNIPCEKCKDIYEISKTPYDKSVLTDNPGDLYNICKKCKHSTLVNDGHVITYDTKGVFENTEVPETYSNLQYDPTLMRTSRFTCKNDQCENSKQIAGKEAITFKQSNSTSGVIYVCCKCNECWVLSLT